MIKCPKCGKELPEGTSFCLYCFTSLAKTDAAPPPAVKGAGAASNTQARKTAALVLLCLFAVAIVCGGTVLLKNRIQKVKPVPAGETGVVTVPGETAVVTVAGETAVVAVTDENGDTVTDKSGEAVSEAVVAVTDTYGEAVTNEEGAKVFLPVVPVTEPGGESVTNESGEQVFAVVTTAPQPETQAESTTKRGWFDRLFGRDDTTTRANTETASTEEPKAGTSARPAEPTTKTTTLSTTQRATTTTTRGPSQAPTQAPTQTPAKAPTQAPAQTPTQRPTYTPTKAPTQAATQTPTQTPTQAPTQTTTQGAKPDSESDFEYDIYNQYVRITKYTGANTNITVPAEIDGTPVGYLGMNAFPSNTKTITFNSDNYSIGYSAFEQCTELEAINFVGASRYRSVDGVVFSGGTLCYYPIGKKTADYSTPEFCKTIGQNSVKNNSYLKTFTITADNMQYADNLIYGNFVGCTSLTAINYTGTSDNLKSVDGVLFYVEHYRTGAVLTFFVYPAGKQDSYYEFPDFGPIRVMEDSFCGNPYIKTIKFKTNLSGSVLHVHNSNYRPKNLEKIYLLDNENQREFLAEGYNAWCFETSHITVEFY